MPSRRRKIDRLFPRCGRCCLTQTKRGDCSTWLQMLSGISGAKKQSRSLVHAKKQTVNEHLLDAIHYALEEIQHNEDGKGEREEK